jgi:hypothetical protein
MIARPWPGYLLLFTFCGVTLFTFDGMSILQLDISQEDAQTELLRVMHSVNPVAIVQLPSVFALIAPSTFKGVEALNRAKSRLPGKHYGSAIGNVNHFIRMATRHLLPDFLAEEADAARLLEGAFIRLKISESGTESPAVTNGTHQGLLLSQGPERNLFIAIENAFIKDHSNPVFAGAHYHAPICTSANISGDALGSIVDLDRALQFGRERSIPLLISNSQFVSQQSGSYPIFAFDHNKVRITRQGPNQERILCSLPSTITVHS